MMEVEILKTKKMSMEEVEDLKKQCEAILEYLKESYFRKEDEA